MLSPEDAVALVVASPLLDEQWYSAQVGVAFATRAEAAAHWVAQAAPQASPHPLFEPIWLWPGRRWRAHTPDPLSFYLTRPEPGGRSPHPRYPRTELGPLEEWLASGGDPRSLLPDAAPRTALGAVVLRVPADDLQRAARWIRYVTPVHPDYTLCLDPDDHDHPTAARRILSRIAADITSVRIGPPADPAETPEDSEALPVVIDLPAGLEPSPWVWIPALLSALDRPGVSAAQPILVGPDHTVSGPLLTGHPVSALARLRGLAIPEAYPAPIARRPAGTDGAGRIVLATDSWLPGPASPQTTPAWAALERVARTPTRVEGVTTLRWSIDIAAGAAPLGRQWGDWHFARSLADALERLGQWVEIDHPETRGRATRAESDVVLVLRGLAPVAPQPGAVNLLWVISHPEHVTPPELAAADHAWAASTTWAGAHGVDVLLQCTDATRFHPGVGEAADHGPALFVGNARGGMRPAVAAAREAAVPMRVVGNGWSEHGVAAAAARIANTDLPGAYAAAPVVLADHHDDMRAAGFVANRVFDVLAVGGRLLVDDVAGLDALLTSLDAGPDVVQVWRTPADLTRLVLPPYAAWPGVAARTALAHRVVAEHSFDARARTLLDAALGCRS